MMMQTGLRGASHQAVVAWNKCFKVDLGGLVLERVQLHIVGWKWIWTSSFLNEVSSLETLHLHSTKGERQGITSWRLLNESWSQRLDLSSEQFSQLKYANDSYHYWAPYTSAKLLSARPFILHSSTFTFNMGHLDFAWIVSAPFSTISKSVLCYHRCPVAETESTHNSHSMHQTPNRPAYIEDG